MHCEQVEMLISQYIFKELGPEESAAVKTHLVDCPACALAHNQLADAANFLDTALHANPEQKLPTETRSKLLAAFEELQPKSEPINLQEEKAKAKPNLGVSANNFLACIAAFFLIAIGMMGLFTPIVKEKRVKSRGVDEIVVAQKIAEEEESINSNENTDKLEKLAIQNSITVYKSNTGNYPPDYNNNSNRKNADIAGDSTITTTAGRDIGVKTNDTNTWAIRNYDEAVFDDKESKAGTEDRPTRRGIGRNSKPFPKKSEIATFGGTVEDFKDGGNDQIFDPYSNQEKVGGRKKLSPPPVSIASVGDKNEIYTDSDHPKSHLNWAKDELKEIISQSNTEGVKKIQNIVLHDRVENGEFKLSKDETENLTKMMKEYANKKPPVMNDIPLKGELFKQEKLRDAYEEVAEEKSAGEARQENKLPRIIKQIKKISEGKNRENEIIIPEEDSRWRPDDTSSGFETWYRKFPSKEILALEGAKDLQSNGIDDDIDGVVDVNANLKFIPEIKSKSYDVSNLVETTKSFDAPDIQPKAEANEQARAKLDENNIKELIMEKIAKGTWDEVKGTSIEFFQGKLMVVNSEEVQKQVADFLAQLRSEMSKQVEAVEVVTEPEPERAPQKVTYNPFVSTKVDALSTFSIDTDSASYFVCKQNLKAGALPSPAQVRPEEFVNAFDYNYSQLGQKTFSVVTDCMKSPLNSNLAILKVGIKGKVLGRDGRKPVHVVLVVDTSGSMAKESRLPLVKKGIEKLVGQLQKGDVVSLVSYGSDVTLNLEYTPVENKTLILRTLNSLRTGGSTDLAKGVMAGYEIAANHFKSEFMNQIIICSDGVANVGSLEADKILKNVEEYKKQGISFTSVGFGSGDYNDLLLEKLANRGDGFYYYVNSEIDMKRVFEQEIGSSFSLIAKDVKLQVAFQENRVVRYRLIGYENRDVADKDFRNNAVDGGEIISGKSVTAFYEIELTPAASAEAYQESLGTVTIRYQNIENKNWEEDVVALTGKIQEVTPVKNNPYFYLGYCAGTFAEILRKSPYVNPRSISQVEKMAKAVVDELDLNNQAKDLLENIQLFRKLQAKE